MGDAVSSQSLVDPATYRARLERCLAVLGAMLEDPRHPFDPGPARAGLELELALVDADGQPAMVNDAVLAAIDDPAFVPEIGRWTIELNSAPTALAGAGLAELQRQVETHLARARERAATTPGAPGVVMIGTLPTLGASHLDETTMSDAARYHHLDEAVRTARGGVGDVHVAGAQTLRTTAATVALEGACTSAQLHLPVAPHRFAATYAAAQLIAGPQVALAANSPFHDGLHLWAESRVPLFTQAVDTRPVELRRQGVAPRVLLGRRWVDSALDLYADDVALYPPLLPELSEEDPDAALAAGTTPALAELRMQTSTVWRWNRAVYDVAHGAAHLRIENRVLPAGPTVVDVMANAALFYGAVHHLADAVDARSLPAGDVEDDFTRCAREGLAATTTWPGSGSAPVVEVLTERVLPAAREGLAALGVDDDVARTHLQVLTERAATGRTGAWWQVAAVAALEGAGATREQALARMTLAYAEQSLGGEPVHTWPLPA